MPAQLRATCRYLAAIETSCDETSFSVLEFNESQGVRILSHLVHSQADLHQPFGGVVPEVAARDHLAHLPDLARQAFRHAELRASDCGAIAVTAGPGLIGAVMVGFLFAQGMAEAHQVPLLAINHVEAHLAPATLLHSFDPAKDLGQWLPLRKAAFPRLSLTVSGGHCLMAYWPDPQRHILLGTTLDDACGEAFDKVAKLLNLGYPGGPAIESRARHGHAGRHEFAMPLSTGAARLKQHDVCPLPFSFSGLKTAVLRAVQACRQPDGTLSDQDTNDIAAAFQQVAINHLCHRLAQGVAYCASQPSFEPVREVVIAGGVAANQHLRSQLQSILKTPVHFAPLALCGDNATMIGLQAYLGAEDGRVVSPYSRYDRPPPTKGTSA